MKIITAGEKFTDIDAFASAIAYSDLLGVKGEQSLVVLLGVLNSSIPDILEAERMAYSSDYQPQPEDRFVVLDVSDPEHIARLVDPAKIDLIVDHHPGYENYWQERSVPSQIETVGAVCTQVFEYWEKAGVLDKMRPEVARLLASGILDNTLNFTAEVTCVRDHEAYSKLLSVAGLDESWAASYFKACQETVDQDVAKALKDDTKYMNLAGIENLLEIGQLVVWDGQRVLPELLRIKQGARGDYPWLVNLVSIVENQSYIICEDEELRSSIGKILSIAEQDGSVMPAGRLWLRKEIIKQAIVKNQVAV